jgi:hypothetical protein
MSTHTEKKRQESDCRKGKIDLDQHFLPWSVIIEYSIFEYILRAFDLY